MAYTYRYQLRDTGLREAINLEEYNEIIIEVLTHHFGENVKDIFVVKNYFEFLLYASVSANFLQEMGRKLKARIPIENQNYGFVRMMQTLYALVYSAQDDDEDTHVEFIDSKILDDEKLFASRADLFWEKSYFSRELSAQEDRAIVKEIKNSYYADILSSYDVKGRIFSPCEDVQHVQCFLVKGYHRRYMSSNINFDKTKENVFYLEKNIDAGYLQDKDNISQQEDEKDNFIVISSIEPLDADKGEEISKKLDFSLATASSINAFDIIDKLKAGVSPSPYLLQVHNVGQAQATSLSVCGEVPFLYFDYGLPFAGNSFTKPPTVTLPIEIDTSIILSHIHKDHWNGISHDIKAFKCSWYIPNQAREKKFNNIIAQIIANGGRVEIINRDFVFASGYLTCGGVSKIDPSRVAKHKHETGLSLRLDAYDTSSKEFNILIPGDQRYDYINNSQLSNLDLLVACHHGGTYCWQKKCKCIPTGHTFKAQMIIYSYGVDNTHDHPSTADDYISAGWVNSYDTTTGDYSLLILL